MNPRSNRVCLGVGSNLGDREKTLEAALGFLRERFDIKAVSSWLETVPVGGPAGQGNYLNGALMAFTEFSVREVLHACLAVEAALGRKRGPQTERWGPRPIDIDLLLYNEAVINEPPELVVPHPRMLERRFVLTPLAEIAPEWLHPVSGLSIAEHLRMLPA